MTGGKVTAIAGSEDAQKGAQAIGTNAFCSRLEDDSDNICNTNISLGMTISATRKGAETPEEIVDLKKTREIVCRSSWVKLEDHTHHDFAYDDEEYTSPRHYCKYCNVHGKLSSFLPHEGYGLVGDTILINSDEDWNTLARCVNEWGIPTKGDVISLKNDIHVTTMIGTEQNPFMGKVYGSSKAALIIELEDYYSSLAPFLYAESAYFSNITIKGRFYSTKQYCGGLVSKGKNCVFWNCTSSITFESSYQLDGCNGGFVGSGSGMEFHDCVFDGSIIGSKYQTTRQNAGFMGLSTGAASKFYYCMFDPSDVGKMDANFAGKLPSEENNDPDEYIHCYYRTKAGRSEQGLKAIKLNDHGITKVHVYGGEKNGVYLAGLKYKDSSWLGSGETGEIYFRKYPSYNSFYGIADYADYRPSSGTMTRDEQNHWILVTADSDIDFFEITNPSVTAPSVKEGLIYNGQPQTLVNDGSVNGGTMWYAVTQNGESAPADSEYTRSVPVRTNAGNYTVWYKVVGDENHHNIDANYVSVSIGKAANPTVVTENLSVMRGSKKIDLSSALAKGDAVGMVSFTLASGAAIGCSLAGNEFTSGNETGIAIVEVTVAEDGNYEAMSAKTIYVEVTEKQTQNLVFENSTATKTYGDPAFLLGVSGAHTELAYYVTSGSNVVEVDALGNVTIKAAGNATITVTASENDSYAQATVTFGLTVNPKAVVIVADDKTKVKGEADPEFTVSVTGLLENESESLIMYTVSRESGSVPGTYSITPAGDAVQGNYSVTYVQGTLTIEPAPTWTVVVENGSGDGDFEAGTLIGISADKAPEGQEFDCWSGTEGVVFADAYSANTEFTMLSQNVTVKANYKAKRESTAGQTTEETQIPTESTEETSTEQTKSSTEETKSVDTDTDEPVLTTEISETVSPDGSTTKTETTSNPDGSLSVKETVTEADGKSIVRETKTDAKGNSSTESVTKDADGNVLVTEIETVKESINGTVTTTTDTKNADGSSVHKTEKITAKGTVTVKSTEIDPEGNKKEIKETVKEDGSSTTDTIKTDTDKKTVITKETVDTEGVKQSREYSVDKEATGKGKKNAGKVSINKLEGKAATEVIPDTIKVDGKTYKVDKIGENALEGNKKVKEVVIGKYVKTIGENAFSGAKKLKDIEIYGKIKNIGVGAFSGISKNAVITIHADEADFERIVELIKASGIGKKVKFVRAD